MLPPQVDVYYAIPYSLLLSLGKVAAAFALGQFLVGRSLLDEHGAAILVDFQIPPFQILLPLTRLGRIALPGLATDQLHGNGSR